MSAWCQLGTDARDCLYLALNGRVLRARYTLGSRGLELGSSGGHHETAMGKPRRPCGERRYPPKCPLFCFQESGGRVRVAVHARMFLEKIASYFFETGFQGLDNQNKQGEWGL